MKDINYPLRKSTLNLLSGMVYNSIAVPVYYSELPSELNPPFYIVFGSISSNDTSTKTSSDTSTLIQVKIFTQKDTKNAGRAADDIAGMVFNRLYPAPYFKTSIPGFQVLKVRLVSDNTQEIQMSAQLKYIDRTLVFSYTVFHSADV